MKVCRMQFCPRKIRDKERSDVNEFLEWLFEKVSNCWLRRAGSNCDNRLNITPKQLSNLLFFLLKPSVEIQEAGAVLRLDKVQDAKCGIAV